MRLALAAVLAGRLILTAVVALASKLADRYSRLGDRLQLADLDLDVTAAVDAHRPRSGRGVVVFGGLVGEVVLAVLRLVLAAVVVGLLALRQGVALLSPLRDPHVSRGVRLKLAADDIDVAQAQAGDGHRP